MGRDETTAIPRQFTKDENENKWTNETKSLSSWRVDRNGNDGMITDALDLAMISMGNPVSTLCPLELIEDRWMFQSIPMHINLIIYEKQFTDDSSPFYEPIMDLLRAENEKRRKIMRNRTKMSLRLFRIGKKTTVTKR